MQIANTLPPAPHLTPLSLLNLDLFLLIVYFFIHLCHRLYLFVMAAFWGPFIQAVIFTFARLRVGH